MGFRIPGWCDHVVVKVNGEEINLEGIVKKGYVYLTRIWNKGNTIELSFEMKVKCIRANPKVRENIGKLALQRGPIIYCIEEVCVKFFSIVFKYRVFKTLFFVHFSATALRLLSWISGNNFPN
ncbi:hypothetical protein NST54_02515 [Caldifermentibacillus hisashii]|uniref:hypothetical protein n=1 Tax=Caldifermentibacillus hisashii TaxID=996558 RepID=UPI0034D6969E